MVKRFLKTMTVALLVGLGLLATAPPLLSAASPPPDAPLPTEAGQRNPDEADWHVDAPPFPTMDVPLDLTQGTWLNLDVSPDGTSIVFDLLGDLYLIPIEGGEAKALTHGMAWDMQPAFSPDGRMIAFTSDREGGDNIHVLELASGKVRAVSHEDFRLLNSPAWSPDGQYIIARKHFTGHRSLGAGEIWIYHRTGGKGVPLTSRPNEQKDVGEPAFSPDGRYVYYSMDVTPGDYFEYNKDPNKRIYAILRLDRSSGAIDRLVDIQGGAIRPTPSPDGTHLAFIRRVRGHSVLELMDLESGRITALFDGLDRDLQETWAIHGVYPRMAFTPEGASIVVWAQGGLKRIDIRSGRVVAIPFHLRTTRKVAKALRFPVQVDQRPFPVKMLRHVAVSPDGSRVVYEALGHLYIQTLPDGRAHRLTRQNDHFEAQPSWSGDGRWIVFVTWDDHDLGSVRRIRPGGGREEILTLRPGHYVEPALNRDGSRAAWRQVTGGDIVSSLWSLNPGLYLAAIKRRGAASIEKLELQGMNPRFSADDRALFVLQRQGKDRSLLVKMDLKSRTERIVAQGDNLTEIRPSPDGHWMLFQHGRQAYVAAAPMTGHPLDLSADMDALPVRQISEDVGDYLQWSGDGETIYYTEGPTLFTLARRDVFDFLQDPNEALEEESDVGRQEGSSKGSEGNPGEEPDEGPGDQRNQNAPYHRAVTIPLGFDASPPLRTSLRAFVGARIITMKGDEIIEDGTILLEGNRIRAIGPRKAVDIPRAAEVVDVEGRTIIPGLVDVHCHARQARDHLIPEQNWVNYAMLAFGVTTCHDPSTSTHDFFAAAEMARAGEILSPRLFSTGTILYGAAGDVHVEIQSVADARRNLRRLKAVGAISVKSYNQPRRDQRQKILAAARELGMMVVPEGGSLFEHNMTMVVDGHTGVEHALPLARVYEDVLQLWSGTEVGYTPTLVVAYGGLFGENYWYARSPVWKHPLLSHFVPPRALDPMARRVVHVPPEEYNHIAAARVAAALDARGVLVQVGGHGQREGLAAHWEMWSLVQGGMTPHHALRAATLNGARYLGLDGDLGSLEEGKLADFAVLDSNPLEDIETSDTVEMVVLDGRLFDAATMDEIVNGKRVKRAPFCWEEEKDRGDER